jgi:hypothetical protein
VGSPRRRRCCPFPSVIIDIAVPVCYENETQNCFGRRRRWLLLSTALDSRLLSLLSLLCDDETPKLSSSLLPAPPLTSPLHTARDWHDVEGNSADR